MEGPRINQDAMRTHEERVTQTLGSITQGLLPSQKTLRMKHPMVLKMIAFSKSVVYRVLITVMTLIALFAFDMTMAFMPKSMDFSTIIILGIVGVLFVLDIIMNLLIRPGYMFSFYFWLDLIGTISIVPDVFEMLELTNADYSNDPTLNVSNDELQVTRAGRAGRLARSAGTLRLAKFARIFRVIRLVRIVRIFRVMKPAGDYQEQSKPSRIGLHLSDLITKRVIVMVICLILTIPQLDYQGDPHTTMEITMTLFASQLKLNETSFLATGMVNDFMKLHKDREIWRCTAGNYTLLGNNYTGLFENRRVNEIVEYSDSESVMFCLFDIKEDVKMQAIFQMLLAIFIVFIFAMGSFAISHETNIVIVKPIERMTVILRKLAGTVFALSMIDDFDENDDEDMEDDADEDMETEMLENIVQKMAAIFNIQEDGTSKDESVSKISASLSKSNKVNPEPEVTSGMRMLLPKLANGDGGEEKAIRNRTASNWIQKPETLAIALPDGEVAALKDHPELIDMELLLREPAAAFELKLFMNQTLNVENFLFWQEVERFQLSCLRQAEIIYQMYISRTAVSEINITSELRQSIHEELYTCDPNKIRVCVFAEAQREVFKLIQNNAHIKFLQSPFAIRYILKKRKRNKGAV